MKLENPDLVALETWNPAGSSVRFEQMEESRRIERIEDLPWLRDIGEEVNWIVDGIFAEGALHMVTSEPGAGKSTVLSAVLNAVARGGEFAGRATSKRPVLLLDAENPETAVRERFRRLGIHCHNDFKLWGQWTGEDPPAAGGAVVLEWVDRCEPKPMIVVDSVIAFHMGDENDSNATRKHMSQYRILTAMGATPVLLHHVGKSETARDYRGSSDYKASIDIGYKLTNLGDGARLSNLELRPFKQRFSVAPVLHLRYDDGVFTADNSETRKTVTERLCDLLKGQPGVTKAEFEALAGAEGLGRNRGRDFVEAGIKSGTIALEPGPRNKMRLFWRGVPVTFEPEIGLQ